MNENERPTLTEPRTLTPHRYQIYRQARNGCHHNHGNSLDSPEDAVALFLSSSPVFEGGGLHLWDHREQRAVASAEWNIETTRFGFTVRTRENVFHDAALAGIARQIAEREAFYESISQKLSPTV